MFLPSLAADCLRSLASLLLSNGRLAQAAAFSPNRTLARRALNFSCRAWPTEPNEKGRDSHRRFWRAALMDPGAHGAAAADGAATTARRC